jgi:hypothetical protein
MQEKPQTDRRAENASQFLYAKLGGFLMTVAKKVDEITEKALRFHVLPNTQSIQQPPKWYCTKQTLA